MFPSQGVMHAAAAATGHRRVSLSLMTTSGTVVAALEVHCCYGHIMCARHLLKILS
jgi:hypothetical protein